MLPLFKARDGITLNLTCIITQETIYLKGFCSFVKLAVENKVIKKILMQKSIKKAFLLGHNP